MIINNPGLKLHNIGKKLCWDVFVSSNIYIAIFVKVYGFILFS